MNQKKFQITFSNSESFLSNVGKIFEKYGVVLIKNLLKNERNHSETDTLKIFHSALHFYRQISNKLSIKTKNLNNLNELDFYVKSLEKIDHQAGLEVQKLISKSGAMMNLSNNAEINNIASNLLNVKKSNLLLENFGNFIPNIPSNSSRLYTWHCENHWLPYRRRFINCWVPLFRKKKNIMGQWG